MFALLLCLGKGVLLRRPHANKLEWYPGFAFCSGQGRSLIAVPWSKPTPLDPISTLSDDEGCNTTQLVASSEAECPELNPSVKLLPAKRRKAIGKSSNEIRSAIYRCVATNCPCSRRSRASCFASFRGDEAAIAEVVKVRMELQSLDLHDADAKAFDYHQF